jgi:hypothetical protein
MISASADVHVGAVAYTAKIPRPASTLRDEFQRIPDAGIGDLCGPANRLAAHGGIT